MHGLPQAGPALTNHADCGPELREAWAATLAGVAFMSRPILILTAAMIGTAIGPLIRAQADLALTKIAPMASPCSELRFAAGRRRQWRGRCHSHVGPPAGTVEVLGGVTLGLLALTTDSVVLLIAYGWVAAFGLALAVVDIAVHRLPNRLTGLLVIGAGAMLAIEAARSSSWHRLTEAVAAGIAAGAFYLASSIVTRGGLGLGDAKLAVGLALTAGWSGWHAAALAITLGFILTGLTGAFLLLLRRVGRKDSLPHAPFMVAATIAAIALTGV